ncbi:putative RNA-directed DNA polymerase from transposon BS [Trichonephila clavipes]|nr:putative RNA-directed DNA polymerase from transposon BS [Trichonephila clavipes]
MEGLFDDNTIILGDFNAKNTTWGTNITNARCLSLSNLVIDKAFLCLNDGTHTFRSNSYGSTDVLDLIFISPGLFPYSSWRVLDNIDSNHLPILVEIDLKVNCNGMKNLHWNFKKADWSLFQISLTILYRKNLFRTTWKRNSPISSTPFLQLLSLQFLGGKVDAWEAAEALTQHYANESRLDFSNYDKHFARITRNQVKSCRDRPADNPLFNVVFTLPKLSYALQNLDIIKSPGPDSIPGHFLPHLGILGREILLYICNLSWKTGKLPRQRKSVIVIPIHKHNKNAGLTTSYRPISLTCIPCKLMEYMVLRRLTHHLHTNNLMPSEQFAFHSYKTYQGIPQSCVLSPTLFSLYISGVEKYVNPSQIGLFVDDVVLWCSDANISKMESQLIRPLVNIQEFADNHKIIFNASKSIVSLFTINRHLYNYSPEVFLMSERLNYSKYSTYLGFTLDLEVNCGKHIEKIANKARKRLKILKYLSGRDWGSDASTLRITYTTLVRPVLEYGYQIYQVASPTNLKRLERVQLSSARIITGLRYSCPTDIVLYEADIQSFTMRFEINSYRYFNQTKSFGYLNRTSSFILNWTSNQCLNRDSPLNYMRKHGFIDFNVDTSTPFSCITPIDSFNHVEF